MVSSLEEVSAPVWKFFWHVKQTAWYHIPEDWNLKGYSSKLNIPCIHGSILVLAVAASSNYCLCTEIIQTLYHSWTWFQQNTWLYKIICSKFYSVSMHACMYFYFGFSDMWWWPIFLSINKFPAGNSDFPATNTA
jgi:hypothetical protein